MADLQTPDGTLNLQFDRAISSQPSTRAEPLGVTCAACHTSIHDEYYDVNGHSVCGRCRSTLEAAADTPTGIAPLAIAAACGFFAAIAGAIIYYIVLAYAHLQIGIVAVLIGYMVGYAVRKGARGGGFRFQVLAVALTYASVALAYTPIAVSGAIAEAKKQPAPSVQPASSNRPQISSTGEQPTTPGTPSAAKLVLGIFMLIGFSAMLPVLVIIGSFPTGIISAFIIFIGLRQAWKMTAAPLLQVLGPYRVGAATTTPA